TASADLSVAGAQAALRLGIPRRGDQPHLLLEREELVLDVRATRPRLEAQELGLERVAGERLVDLGVRDAAALLLLDLVGHPVEGLERGSVGQTGHRLVDPTLGLGTLLLRDQEVTLALGFLDLVVELAERALELLRLTGLRLPRLLQDVRPIGVLLLPDQRLLG